MGVRRVPSNQAHTSEAEVFRTHFKMRLHDAVHGHRHRHTRIKLQLFSEHGISPSRACAPRGCAIKPCSPAPDSVFSEKSDTVQRLSMLRREAMCYSMLAEAQSDGHGALQHGLDASRLGLVLEQ